VPPPPELLLQPLSQPAVNASAANRTVMRVRASLENGMGRLRRLDMNC
jgi:hypothetical protein